MFWVVSSLLWTLECVEEQPRPEVMRPGVHGSKRWRYQEATINQLEHDSDDLGVDSLSILTLAEDGAHHALSGADDPLE